jgi:hypothetical protein
MDNTPRESTLYTTWLPRERKTRMHIFPAQGAKARNGKEARKRRGGDKPISQKFYC